MSKELKYVKYINLAFLGITGAANLIHPSHSDHQFDSRHDSLHNFYVTNIGIGMLCTCYEYLQQETTYSNVSRQSRVIAIAELLVMGMYWYYGQEKHKVHIFKDWKSPMYFIGLIAVVNVYYGFLRKKK
eukprot:882761_1